MLFVRPFLLYRMKLWIPLL
ncbi:hypothetical protein Gotri_017185 [Gossypium trilobum]|uniref:Uncharacterized protein n=1 Tax=Gossypium trilobum TaxID=34281 RepID=A0A7J9E5T4_9ROSI|nr:hypothetical protein [Gossypium trilobum]